MKTWSLSVDHDVGDLLIFEQRLEGAETKDLVEQISLDLLLLIKAERDPAITDDHVDDARDRLPSLAGVDAR